MPLSTGRRLQAVRGREEEIVAAFLRLRSDAAVAREVGLQVRQVRRVVDANVPEARVLRRAKRSSSQTYADQELIEALREAARELPSPLAIESYRRWSHAEATATVARARGDHPEVRWLATGTRSERACPATHATVHTRPTTTPRSCRPSLPPGGSCGGTRASCATTPGVPDARSSPPQRPPEVSPEAGTTFWPMPIRWSMRSACPTRAQRLPRPNHSGCEALHDSVPTAPAR